jgi:hypothetical protein
MREGAVKETGGGVVPISIELKLSSDERAQLAGILKCDLAELDSKLEAYGRSALEEYARMFIGQRVFTRGSDIREYRLFLLVKEPFGSQIPDEQLVSDLFQTTATQSRSLIRSVMSKYQYELQDAIDASLKQTVERAEPEEDDWTVTVNSENIVESLNRVIGSRISVATLVPVLTMRVFCFVYWRQK